MNKQLSFLPKIDRTATQEKLEGVLESVRIYRQFGMIRKEMKVTSSYEMREHGPTHTVGKPLEDVAIANLQQSEYEEWLELMSFRINQFLIVDKNRRKFKNCAQFQYKFNELSCNNLIIKLFGCKGS